MSLCHQDASKTFCCFASFGLLHVPAKCQAHFAAAAYLFTIVYP